MLEILVHAYYQNVQVLVNGDTRFLFTLITYLYVSKDVIDKTIVSGGFRMESGISARRAFNGDELK